MTNHRRCMKKAFALHELLVVIALVAIAATLLLPALRRAQDEAQRTECINNLKKFGLAVHNYNDQYLSLPSGSCTSPSFPESGGGSAHVRVLPYLDESTHYDRYNACFTPQHPANETVVTIAISVFVCPADIGAKSGKPQTNYHWNAGKGPWWLSADGKQANMAPNGVIFENSAIRLREITDGTSKTLMALESTIGSESGDKPDSKSGYVLFDTPLPATIEGNAGDSSLEEKKNLKFDRGHHWANGQYLQTMIFGALSPNSEHPDVSYKDLSGGISATRSSHEKGSLVLYVDGSVQFVSNNLDAKILAGMCTRAGDEPRPSF